LRPGFRAFALSLIVAGVAARALFLALSANPLGAILTVVGAVAGALLGLAGSFGKVAEDAEKAVGALEAVKHEMEEIKGRGFVKNKEMMEAFTPEERQAFKEAKSPAEKQEITRKAAERAKKELEAMPGEDVQAAS